MVPSPRAMGRSGRWAVLAAYTFVLGVSQLLWLNFAPLLTLVQRRYGVSEELASSLVFLFPLLYVFLSVPAGALIDRRGYRVVVAGGAALMTISACVRIVDQSFWCLFAGQAGAAIAQPFVANAISKLVTDWFPEEHGAIATGVGTMGMFVGMAIGMAATPPLVDALGLAATMAVFAAITAGSAVVFVVVVPADGRAAGRDEAAVGLGPLLRDRDLRVLLVLSFLGLGVFNGLTTWLEQILAPRGIDADQAGLVGGAIILGGIGGAVVIPAISDATRRRKPFLIGCAAAALATLYPLCTSERFAVLIALGALLGFLFLPAYALLLEMSAQLAGRRAAGAATGLLMLAGNAGGVIVVVAMPIVKGDGDDFGRPVLLMLALLASTLVLALFAPEPFTRARAHAPVDDA
jgi:predicted MFS family arabinose efflux permease